jgi:hypothetical protein
MAPLGTNDRALNYLFIYLFIYAILLCPKECVCMYVCVRHARCRRGAERHHSLTSFRYWSERSSTHQHPHEGWMDGWMNWMDDKWSRNSFSVEFQLTLAVIIVVKFSGFSTTYLLKKKNRFFWSVGSKKTSPFQFTFPSK